MAKHSQTSNVDVYLVKFVVVAFCLAFAAVMYIVLASHNAVIRYFRKRRIKNETETDATRKIAGAQSNEESEWTIPRRRV